MALHDEIKYLDQAMTAKLINDIKTRLATKNEVFQLSSMPTLTSENITKYAIGLYQYTGNTTEYYSNGAFYKANSSDPQNLYWEKATYNKTEIDNAIATKNHFIVVNELPSINIDPTAIYFVPAYTYKNVFLDSTNNFVYGAVPGNGSTHIPSSTVIDTQTFTLDEETSMGYHTGGYNSFTLTYGSPTVTAAEGTYSSYGENNPIAIQIDDGPIDLAAFNGNTHPTLAAGTHTVKVYTTVALPDYAKFNGTTGAYISTVTGNDAKAIYDAIQAGTYTEVSKNVQWGIVDGTKDEYIYIESTSTWEKIGNTNIDLSGYVMLSDLVPITTAEIEAMWNSVT